MDFPAILLYGETGFGLWEYLSDRAAGRLCEHPGSATASASGVACRACAACALVAAGTHPDLFVLMPEAVAIDLGARATSGDGDEASADKRAPSREIPIDAVRRLVDWSHTTSHRGGAKVACVYPLNAMAPPAANALLKTLEEPAPGLWFLMATHRLDQVMPTLRSRCRLQSMHRPSRAAALEDLRARGVANPEDLAAWCRDATRGLAPEQGAEGLAWARHLLALLDAGPQSLGAVGAPPPPPVAVAALQKLAVDLQRARLGMVPLYLPAQRRLLEVLGARMNPTAWLRFWERMGEAGATANFPLHAGLVADRWALELRQLFTASAT